MDELIATILDECDYVNNPYFTNLNDGKFDKDDFIETQIQFYFAVIFFPRPMAAAAAKIPTHKSRLEVMRNVWEEHGVGNEKDFHGNTFLKFLEQIGTCSETDVLHRKLWPEVRAFNTALAGACISDEYIVSVSMLGMIELMFSKISSLIGLGVVTNGWVGAQDLVHYNTHEKLDVKHAQDFFDVLNLAWENTDEDRYLIEQGLRMGAYCFNNLYSGLYSNRSKRMISETPIHRHQRT